ncbi:MAG: glutaminyl-peptide cyclotransferase [Acidobacteria bacterium]|nr:glutaminyl-peptide cyclotransferase [Acidobacteriota bacterium]
MVGCSPGTETASDTPSQPASTASAGQEVLETFQVVREHPHDASAFTQGLTFHNGFLYEGTGRRGQSSVRRVDIESGRVEQRSDLSPVLFGEGIALHDGRVYQLTWTSGLGFIYDLESFEVVEQFRQFTQGWGLTSDGESLIQSDGTANLYFIDPATMQPSRTVQVHDANGIIDQVNELEYIDGDIYANVWHSWEILRISPRDGRVIGRVDMSGIFDTNSLPDPESVLNGIAYDPDTGRIWITGKLWPKLFEVRFVRE